MACAHGLMQALDEKVIIFKKKRRKNYRRTTGHRQVGTEPYRCLLVLDVCSGLLGIPKRYFLRFCTPKDQTVSGFFFHWGLLCKFLQELTRLRILEVKGINLDEPFPSVSQKLKATPSKKVNHTSADTNLGGIPTPALA